ncbi:PACE efflux transporter [Chromobacterium haemolyticum]|nr:PACE efflux transporter [Chromobacterium haemolyticum]
MHVKKSWLERAFYAVTYELCAISLLMLLATLLLKQDTAQIGMLALMMTSVAMSWNIVFNSLFERWERRRGWARTPALRVVHALLFEGGLVILLVPLAAWWLQISYWQAFLLASASSCSSCLIPLSSTGCTTGCAPACCVA